MPLPNRVDARLMLGRLAFERGVRFPRGRYAPVGLAIEGSPGDSWTAAWSSPHRYVEGIGWLAGRMMAHAWCLDADGTVIEVTPVWEAAERYIGIELSRVSVALYSFAWTAPPAPRSSAIEAAFVAGWSEDQVMDRLAVRQ